MAKRKAYRGMPAEHKKAALEYAKIARSTLRELSPALRAGNCDQALAIIGQMREYEGSYYAHRAEVGRGKYRGEYALFKQTAKAMNAFRKRCVR